MPDLYLVGFKGNRKEFFFNKFHHSLKTKDYVIVQVDRGEDIGVILQKIDKEVDFSNTERPGTVLRPANDEDIDKLNINRNDENTTWDKALKLIEKHQLEMKLVDIEYQFDRNKITFFFTAEHRVDFRALVRDLAAEYKTRIELRQIGVRDEAKRIDGFGVCGNQQCCSSFLTSFEPISTQDARIQNLSLNPSKISGNCGRLLCCLKYEVDYYSSILEKYPEVGCRFSGNGVKGIVDRISVFEDYMIVIDEDGQEQKVTGKDLLKLQRKPKDQDKQEELEPVEDLERDDNQVFDLADDSESPD
jgi:cell fate regulator YaaT (PSP1 superfamily)